jgi:hypothetical protein
MLGTPLRRDEVVQVGKLHEESLLTTPGMMNPFHHEELAVYSVMGLV